MADAGVFNADLGINMQFNIDGAGLVEMTKTIKEIAQGKDLEKYWTDVETATDKAVKAAQRYNKNLDSDRLAGSFLKQINALKALTGKEDVSDLFSGIGIDINSLVQSAKDVVPKINSEFSPDKFSQAFKTFDMLKDKGIELGRVFEKLASYNSLSDRFFKVYDENNELKALLGDMDINEVKKQLSEIQKLRQQAEESFDNFLTANTIDRKDWYGDERFIEYFDAIRSGTMTATDAITRFKTEYAYLLEESFKTSGNNFGLDQLQEFSKKLDSIFLRVEETSKKISDIISNGVITKMTQDVPGESNLTNGQVLFNKDQLKSVLDLLGDIKDSLFSLRSVISDVGDGQEFSPLLQTIKEITGAVESLKQSVSKIGLNINIDAGEPDQKLLSNIEAKKQNLLNAYQSQFTAMKNFKIPGSIIAQGNIQNRDRVAALNKQILNFDGGASADNIDQRIAAYTKVIEIMREASKLSYGRDVYADMDSSFKNVLSSAKGQLTKAQNELANSNALGSGIENLFESKDLDQVVVQLSRIVDKFEEIANAENDFKTKFADGINVTTSIEEIQKLTQRVQELEAELSKIKAINPPTVQEPKKDAFHENVTPVDLNANSSSTAIKEESDALEETAKNAKSAADAKTEFANANKKVEQSAESSASVIKNESDALKNIENIAPKTERFDEIIQKLDIAKDRAEQIEKIVENTQYSKADKKSYTSYDITYKNGYKETRGENSQTDRGNVLKSSGVEYDAKAEAAAATKSAKEISDAFDEATKFNQQFDNSLAKTISQLKELSVPKGFESSFDELQDKVSALGHLLATGKLSPSEYDSQITSSIKDYNSSINSKAVETWKELNSAIKQYGDIMQRFAQGKLLHDDIEDADKLLARIHELQESDILPVDKLNDSKRMLDAIDRSFGNIAETVDNATRQKGKDYVENAKKRLTTAMAKYNYGDTSEANDYIKFLNINPFHNYQNLDGDMKTYNAEIERIVANLKASHESFASLEKDEDKAWAAADKVNDALDTTNALLKTLESNIPEGFAGNFKNAKDEIEKLNKDLTSGKKTVAEYNSGVKSAFKGYTDPIDEAGKNVWKELSSDLQRYSQLQQRIANGKAYITDAADAQTLLDRIHELQRSDVLPSDKLKESNEKLRQINQTVEDITKSIKMNTLDNVQDTIDKYRTFADNKNNKPADQDQSVKYKQALANLNKAIQALEDYKVTLSGVDKITEENESKIKELTGSIEKYANTVKSMSAAEKGSNERSRMKEADKITKYLQQNTRLSKEAKKQLESYVNLLRSSDANVDVGKIHTEWLKVTDAERAAGREGKSFFDVVKEKAWYGAASAIGTYFGVNDFIRYGQQAIQAIVALDDAMVDLKKTTSMGSSQLEDFYYDSNNVAKQMGVTTQEIIEQASAWSRLGYNNKDASTEMAKLSSQFASISPGMSTDTAQEGLISIMKAWRIDPNEVKSEVIDPINQLGNNFALTNQDIIEGMERSAAALAATGTTYKEAFSLFTGAQEVLQNSEVAGRALRSISLRIHGYSESSEDGLLETDDELKTVTGDLADLTKTAEHSQGVSIFKPGSTTEFKSLVDYFGEIHDIWDEMSQRQQNDFLQKAFGKTQADVCLNVQKCA